MATPERIESRRKLVELHLLPEHLIAIGHVAVRSAVLDLIIEFTVESISKPYPEIARKGMLELSTPKKIDLTKQALTKDLPKSEYAIAEFISEVHAARVERDAIIHRIWEKTDTAEEKKLIDPRHWIKRAPKRTTDKTMMALATRMIDLTFELGDWKMLSNQARMRQQAASRGMPTLLGPLPNPPRVSQKDEQVRMKRQPGPRPGT
jgi:hypothetical protein